VLTDSNCGGRDDGGFRSEEFWNFLRFKGRDLEYFSVHLEVRQPFNPKPWIFLAALGKYKLFFLEQSRNRIRDLKWHSRIGLQP
jgi:hypothetical protein